MTAALAGVLFAWLCLFQGAYGVANLGPEVRDPANFLPPRILVGADVTTSIKPSRPQTLDRQATASGIPDWLSREPLGESESLNLYSYCHNDPINKVDVLGLAPKLMTDEQGKAYDRMLTEMVRAGVYDANTHSTILSMMELDGILQGSGRGDRARMSEYLSQTGSVATDNSILVATIGTAADVGSGIVSAIPGMGPDGDGATDGSNTNGMLLIDTFRANAAALISIGNFNSPAIQSDMGEFTQGYESKYSYAQRSVAQGLVFAAPFAPKAGPVLKSVTNRVANLHPVFNPSFAGRPGFASGMVRSPLPIAAKTTPSVISVTPQGVAISSHTLARQGNSHLAGNFRGLAGASVDDVFARVPASWTWGPQRSGRGIVFRDTAGFERIRMHGPSMNAPAGSNSRNGWTLRVMDRAENYFDDAGNLVPYRANDGHIPLFGNPNFH